MKDFKVTSRILADVEVDVKEKLLKVLEKRGQTTKGFMTEAIEKEYNLIEGAENGNNS